MENFLYFLKRRVLILICLLFALFIPGCSPAGENTGVSRDYEKTVEAGEASGKGTSGEIKGLKRISSLELKYADQFSAELYEDGYRLITIADEERFLLVPEGKDIPEGLDEDITPIHMPFENVYLASSSAMDFYRKLDTLDTVGFTSTEASGWSLPDIKEMVLNEEIIYAGKYSSPDYELLLSKGCDLAVENTMIFHNPGAMELLEKLGVPVIVERSSYESHPLGRMEWVKFYGLLSGKEEEAEAFFDEKIRELSEVLTGKSYGKKVAFFYITAAGLANIRKPGDYVPKMIELSGGEYAFSDLAVAEDNASSSMNITMEEFYERAVDADILIYNCNIDGEIFYVDELLKKNDLLRDFKAVKEKRTYCTSKDMFQEATGAAEMIKELEIIISGKEGDTVFIHPLLEGSREE